jgi:hypothetical protein
MDLRVRGSPGIKLAFMFVVVVSADLLIIIINNTKNTKSNRNYKRYLDHLAMTTR